MYKSVEVHAYHSKASHNIENIEVGGSAVGDFCFIMFCGHN